MANMSDDSLRAKVLDKIRKALNIAKDDAASEGEIQAAMNAAHKLMDLHHLTEEDLKHEPADDYAKVRSAEMNRFRSWVGGRVFAWEENLAYYVSKYVGVPYYLDNTKATARDENGLLKRDWWFKEPWKGKSFVFYGVAEDAKMARDIYDELRVTICTLAYGKFNNIYVKEGGKYSEGFVYGLRDNLAKQTELKRLEAKSSSTALVLIARRNDLIKFKTDLASTWLKDKIGIKLTQGAGNYGASGSNSAFNEGFKDGKKTDVEVTRTKKLGVK